MPRIFSTGRILCKMSIAAPTGLSGSDFWRDSDTKLIFSEGIQRIPSNQSRLSVLCSLGSSPQPQFCAKCRFLHLKSDFSSSTTETIRGGNRFSPKEFNEFLQIKAISAFSDHLDLLHKHNSMKNVKFCVKGLLTFSWKKDSDEQLMFGGRIRQVLSHHGHGNTVRELQGVLWVGIL